MIAPEGFPHAVLVPRPRASYWQDRLRRQAQCLENIGAAGSGLWGNDAQDTWGFINLEDAVLFQLTWCCDAA